MSKSTERTKIGSLIKESPSNTQEYLESFGREVLATPLLFKGREWLLTNGLGGYASSTVVNLNTRGYHGLLVAAVPPSGERLVLLNRLEEVVELPGEAPRRFALDTNEYPGTLTPQGYLDLELFTRGDHVEWTYDLAGKKLQKKIAMEYGENRTVIQYVNSSDVPMLLTVRPLLTYRNFHHLRKKADNWQWTEKQFSSGIELVSDKGWPFYLQISPNGDYAPEQRWYYNVLYATEQARGLDHLEDLYTPGYFRFKLLPGESCMLNAALEKTRDFSFKRVAEKENQRLYELQQKACPVTGSPETQALQPLYQKLLIAADQFIIKKPDGRRTVIAGYPWFEDWGRDTFIALPGLLLVTGRFAEAKEIIQGFVPYIRNGIVPNYINPDGTAAYNSIDASLWYIYAVYKYVQYTGDLKLAEKLYPYLEEIVHSYRKGTAYSIKTDWDELLMTGPEGAQLTWMDAKVGDRVITPRWGKAVEINALWYNVLCIMAEFEEKLHGHKEYINMAVRVRDVFAKSFWSEKNKYLFDLLQGDEKDSTLRPNQILAVALPFSLLSERQEKCVVDIIEKELLTPVGLRTLPVTDPRYHGNYDGNRVARDEAYHQGTVWAWLLGPFITAYLKVNKKSKISCQNAKKMLLAIEGHLSEAGILSISEIFDGDSPHKPRGATAQAWSVAEVLRAGYENLLH